MTVRRCFIRRGRAQTRVETSNECELSAVLDRLSRGPGESAGGWRASTMLHLQWSDTGGNAGRRAENDSAAVDACAFDPSAFDPCALDASAIDAGEPGPERA